MDRLTVTADTNSYVSALPFDDQPDVFLRLARHGLIRLTVSEPILAEVRGVLRDKLRRDPTDLADIDLLIRGVWRW